MNHALEVMPGISINCGQACEWATSEGLFSSVEATRSLIYFRALGVWMSASVGGQMA